MPLHLLPRSLRYVLAVAEYGSVQAASRALNIAASAIDRQIRALEEASEVLLFERMPRGMRPTVAGEATVVLARRWKADEERLEDGFKEMRGREHGMVRIAAMDSLVNSVLVEIVEWVHREHPRIHLSIDIVTPTEAARVLEEGAVDAVVAFNLPPSRHQHRLWSAQLPIGCALSPKHPLAQAEELTIKMLSDYPTVSQSVILPIRRYLDSSYGWLFSQNAPVLSTNSLQLLKHVLRKGILVMVTSEMDVLPEIESGELVFIPIRDRNLKPQSLSVAVDTRRPFSRAARAVLEHLGGQMDARLRNVTAPEA
jgi:DNA-binding transcriptional LysR family regulator